MINLSHDYTLKEAEKISKMDCREMAPKAGYEFMTCQIGKRSGGLYHLKAFGATWTAALKMLRGSKGVIEVSTPGSRVDFDGQTSAFAEATADKISAGNNISASQGGITKGQRSEGRNPSSPAESNFETEDQALTRRCREKGIIK